jgi:hypothetical protein
LGSPHGWGYFFISVRSSFSRLKVNPIYYYLYTLSSLGRGKVENPAKGMNRMVHTKGRSEGEKVHPEISPSYLS